MKININNISALQSALDEVQKRARVRLISAENIIYALNQIQVPKSRLNGTVVYYDGSKHFPSCYKGKPESTHWKAENKNGKWYVTNIRRDICPNRKGHNMQISWSDLAKQWILDNSSKMIV